MDLVPGKILTDFIQPKKRPRNRPQTFINADFANFPEGLRWLHKKAAELDCSRSELIRSLVRKEMELNP